MKKILVGIALLLSIPSFAYTDEEEYQKPMHYALVPSVGYHFGVSEMSGESGLSSGFAGGLGLRFERDGYFFTPTFRLIGLIGLEKSPLAMTTIGFIAGGHVKIPSLDVFCRG